MIYGIYRFFQRNIQKLVSNPALIMPQKMRAVDYCITECTLSETMKQKIVPLCIVRRFRRKAENHFRKSFSNVPL